MDRETFDELRAEFNEALPGLIRGEPDRTDLMISLDRAICWQDPEYVVSPDEVRDAVLEIYGVTLAELCAHNRGDEVTIEARQMAAYVMVRNCSISTTRAGRALRRDHSTVIYGVRKIGERMADPAIGRRHEKILLRLYQ